MTAETQNDDDNITAWIFQANPKRYDIDRALKVLNEFAWSVTAYKERIKATHTIYIWKTGPKGGIVAEATAISDPRLMIEDATEKKFYADKSEFGLRELRSRIRITRVFAKPVAPREIMEKNEVLKDSAIFKRPFAGTNLPIRSDERALIEELIDQSERPANEKSDDKLAYLTWPILVDRAERGSVISYEELGGLIDKWHRDLGDTLELIYDLCAEKNLPILSLLVVLKGSDKPSAKAFPNLRPDELLTLQKEVYRYDWSKMPNPFLYASDGTTKEELMDKMRRSYLSPAAVYRLVKERGVLQIIFRDRLLELYDSCCAFCGLSLPQALEAAHIVPWSLALDEERVDACNGLLLCATHHRLFDAHVIRISPDHVITVDKTKLPKSRCASDRALIEQLHNEPVRLPRNRACIPSPELIVKRYAARN